MGKHRKIYKEKRNSLLLNGSKHLGNFMNRRRTEIIRERLFGLISTLSKEYDPTRVSGNYSADFFDRATVRSEQEVAVGVANLNDRQLAQIERALQKLEDGTYRTCDYCGGQIPRARHKAVPYAIYCVPCQEEIEKNDGDPHQEMIWGDDESVDALIGGDFEEGRPLISTERGRSV